MSDAELDADDNRAHCPNCGCATLDGGGHFYRRFRRIRGGGDETYVRQSWWQAHCPDCDQTFGLMVDETEVERRDCDPENPVPRCYGQAEQDGDGQWTAGHSPVDMEPRTDMAGPVLVWKCPECDASATSN